jgi:Flp pilus assembly pilin Flp
MSGAGESPTSFCVIAKVGGFRQRRQTVQSLAEVTGVREMSKLTWKLHLTIQALREEQGQDMIEYILVGGIVPLGAVPGMQTFASDINSAFASLGSVLSTYG